MDSNHPDIPTMSPLEQDALGVVSVVEALTKAGFTEDQSMKYVAIRSAVSPINTDACPNCGHKP
ncbi:hypothetical protein HYP71_gp076 [Arthrobacter phage KBurrousTX]|uniref:Uncharacterized protein n=1 Tax=Arthrobacter phage KBurrousTX TaxID=2315608 RepID=A0A386KBF8_9CAUD|nr:hypothetical protein HYP71_gp076 [Arthrobacter phage KBurrousTX]AYD81570.1 hypothetical protein KBurrousTX_76 [Arthrobacter phage KBurrousTX]